MIRITRKNNIFYFGRDKGIHQHFVRTFNQCELCGAAINPLYAYLINKLREAKLIKWNYPYICCNCYNILQSETKTLTLDLSYFPRYIVVRTEKTNRVVVYPASVLDKCKNGSEIEKKLYKKIMGL